MKDNIQNKINGFKKLAAASRTEFSLDVRDDNDGKKMTSKNNDK